MPKPLPDGACPNCGTMMLKARPTKPIPAWHLRCPKCHERVLDMAACRAVEASHPTRTPRRLPVWPADKPLPKGEAAFSKAVMEHDMGEVFAKHGRRYKPPGEARLGDEHMDPELAVLIVAAKLERQGRIPEAAALKLELGELLIRAALHRAKHPGPVALGYQMYAALHLEQVGVKLGQSGVPSGVRAKAPKKRKR